MNQQTELVNKRNLKHGFARHSKISNEYISWRGMKVRCLNPKDKDFHRYGARGIRVCERWMDFENFISDMGRCPDGMQLDRINNDGNYEPGNCRWTDRSTQARNRRSSRMVTANGRTQTIAAWVDETGIPKTTLRCRLVNGWSEEKSVTFPVRFRSRNRERLRK